jgi:hypothetical protein
MVIGVFEAPGNKDARRNVMEKLLKSVTQTWPRSGHWGIQGAFDRNFKRISGEFHWGLMLDVQCYVFLLFDIHIILRNSLQIPK